MISDSARLLLLKWELKLQRICLQLCKFLLKIIEKSENANFFFKICIIANRCDVIPLVLALLKKRFILA